MDKTITMTDSKYIKPSKKIKVFFWASIVFLFTLFVLPQYFGIPFPLFDFTVIRIMIIVMILLIFGEKQRQQQLFEVMSRTYSKVLIPYLIVLTYTLVLRVDINALLNPLIELISLYLLIYIIQYCLGIKKTLHYLLIFSYIIAFLGLIEFVIHRSPFSYLETIKGIYTGAFIRSGQYRIMGPAIHSLGYGLMLIIMIPICCFDIEKQEINILKNKLLFLAIAANIFFTGSRSTLIVFFLEVVMLALFSPKVNKKKFFIIGGVFIVIFISMLIVFRNIPFINSIIIQIVSVIDELLGTTYSVKFGADISALSSSSHYREQLKYIFQIDWLNPWIGLGRKRSFACEINGSFIQSVDNFYIAEYIRYAYPGMISYIIFLLYFLIRMLKNSIQKKSQISKMLFIGSLGFCINLLWVDSLQTFKYLYILFAIFSCLPENYENLINGKRRRVKVISKYIKNRDEVINLEENE
ncbi:hypothetical protein [Anaeromicropila herbilytica]|uniref:O-antigen ligase domain-containing protein n=1 Tax=Anaeromicropila herbilytica TaxID=2785025 RepID=A0A7R7IB05_9FIRM|nr:hypothetical protein [Anaeromicropila herbilytica]BCN29017.1 hypothetical protein bsdtb5_03120 [Anaeromicropila herbilytica]